MQVDLSVLAVDMEHHMFGWIEGRVADSSVVDRMAVDRFGSSAVSLDHNSDIVDCIDNSLRCRAEHSFDFALQPLFVG